ncbi:MAG: hypothetical protein U1B84_17950, partial [Variovorax sp.]|nr:hypothetical protein [Variovorax sp.]
MEKVLLWVPQTEPARRREFPVGSAPEALELTKTACGRCRAGEAWGLIKKAVGQRWTRTSADSRP